MPSPNPGLLEQLWFTSSAVGLGEVRGYRVRAASPKFKEVANPEVRAFFPFMRYALPKGMDQATKPEGSPVSLSLIQLQNKRVIVNKRYAGLDYTGRRYGNFFAHLVDLPESWTAREVIERWGSEFWKYDDKKLAKEKVDLPSISHYEVSKGEFTAESFARQEKVRQQLTYVIQALLTMQAGQRLYIAAMPDEVAALIWGATHALPRELLRNLTFTTFEQEVTQATVDVQGDQIQIIGTCWSNEELKKGKVDLPPVCYQGQNLGLNCYQPDRATQLGQNNVDIRYAQYIADLRLNFPGEMDLILDACDNSPIGKKGFFELLGLYSNAVHLPKLSGTDRQIVLEDLLKRQGLGRKLLERPGIYRVLVEQVLRDPKWLISPNISTYVNRAQVGGMPWTEVRRELLQKAKEELESETPRIEKIEEYIQAIGIVSLPDTSASPFRALFRILEQDLNKSPDSYLWDTRAWLLKNLASDPTTAFEIPKSWLAVNWTDLLKLLDLQQLPPRWKEEALAGKFVRGSSADVIPQTLADSLTRHNPLFKQVLENVLNGHQQKMARAVSLKFFDALVQQNYQASFAVLDLLIENSNDDGDFIEHLVTLSWQKNAVLSPTLLKRLMEERQEQLVYALEKRSQVRQLIRHYLLHIDWSDLWAPITRKLIKRFESQKQEMPDVQPILESRLVLLDVYNQVESQATALLLPATLKAALNYFTPDKKKQVRDAIVVGLGRKYYEASELASLLEIYSEPFEIPVSDLFGELLRHKSNSRDIIKLLPFFQLAFTVDPNFSSRFPFVASSQVECRNHLGRLIQRIDEDGIFQELDQRLQNDTTIALKEWRNFVETKRPPKIQNQMIGVVRDGVRDLLSTRIIPSFAKTQTKSDPHVTYVDYEIKPGETLLGIAKEKLGDEHWHNLILSLNGEQVAMVKEGQIVRIPMAVEGYRLYTVKDRTKLESIAEKELGSETRYIEIQDLKGNPVPSLVTPPELLVLPIYPNQPRETEGSIEEPPESTDNITTQKFPQEQQFPDREGYIRYIFNRQRDSIPNLVARFGCRREEIERGDRQNIPENQWTTGDVLYFPIKKNA